MKLIKIKCKNCGATLDVNKNLKKITCNYCEKENLIDDKLTIVKNVDNKQTLKEQQNKLDEGSKKKETLEKTNTKKIKVNKLNKILLAFYIIDLLIMFFKGGILCKLLVLSQAGLLIKMKLLKKEKRNIKTTIKKGKDILRYIFGVFFLLLAFVLLLSKDTIISGLLLGIFGISLMPFVYNILKETKTPKVLITFLSIVVPIIFLFTSIMLIPSDEKAPETKKADKKTNEIKKISNILDDYLSITHKEKEIEVKADNENGKYDVFIHYSVPIYEDGKDIGYETIKYIENVKAEHRDDIDSKILKYIFYFYERDKKKFTVEYINNNSDKVEQIEIINNDNKEKVIYKAADYQEKIKKIKEEQETAEQRWRQEEEKKEQERKKKNTKVEHSVGETVICPDFNVTLDSFTVKKEGTRIDSFTVIDDPEWIGVILTIKNTSSGRRTFYTSDLKLQNSSGEIIEHSFWNYNIWGAVMLDSPTLNPKGRKTGYVSFANTNQDDSNLKLLVSCNDKLISEDTKYIFNLK